MQRDRAYLQDIIDAARLAMSYLDGVSEQEFADRQQGAPAGRRCQDHRRDDPVSDQAGEAWENTMRKRSSSPLCTTLLLGALASLPMSGLALTPFPEDGLWGYVDSSGAFVVEPQYARASAFNAEGFAVVEEPRLKGTGYWIMDPDKRPQFPMAIPPRDPEFADPTERQIVGSWHWNYAFGSLNLFELLGFHGDPIGPHTSRMLSFDLSGATPQLEDLKSLDAESGDPFVKEVQYLVLNRDGDVIHRFTQNHWMNPTPLVGNVLYYEEVRDEVFGVVTMAWFDLQTKEQGRIPLEEGMNGSVYGEHLIVASRLTQFLQFALSIGEGVDTDVEAPLSRIIDRSGEVLFRTSGVPRSLNSGSEIFQIEEDGKHNLARLPDGIFAGPFHRCLGFSDQRGLVLLDENTFTYVDEEGTLLSATGVAYASLFRDGHAVIRRHGSPRWEVITPDLATDAVIEGVDEVLRPTVGAIPFRRGEKWGYLNLDGTEKIPAQFDAVSDFEDGVALALNETTFILINETGGILRESTLPSHEIQPLPPFPGLDPFEMRHDPNEPFGRDPMLEQRQRR